MQVQHLWYIPAPCSVHLFLISEIENSSKKLEEVEDTNKKYWAQFPILSKDEFQRYFNQSKTHRNKFVES